MPIVQISKGSIKLLVQDRTVTIDGEAYARGYGNPDFVVYADSIRKWDPPNEDIPIDDNTRNEILKLVKSEMAKRNMTIEIE